jgi:hypothetical protein
MFLKNTTTHRREARQILMNHNDKNKAKMQVNTHPNIEGTAIFSQRGATFTLMRKAYLLLWLLLLLLRRCTTSSSPSSPLSLLALPWHNWHKVAWHLSSPWPDSSQHLLLVAKTCRLYQQIYKCGSN